MMIDTPHQLKTLDLNIYSRSIISNQKTSSVKKAGELYSSSKAKDSSPVKRALLIQWEQLSLREIKKADTYEKAHAAWKKAPTYSYVKDRALEKMLELAKEPKLILTIFNMAPVNSHAKYLAYEKLQKIEKKRKRQS